MLYNKSYNKLVYYSTNQETPSVTIIIHDFW